MDNGLEPRVRSSELACLQKAADAPHLFEYGWGNGH
jgi:hypothetical protein